MVPDGLACRRMFRILKCVCSMIRKQYGKLEIHCFENGLVETYYFERPYTEYNVSEAYTVWIYLRKEKLHSKRYKC
jgi:hypothetical protein